MQVLPQEPGEEPPDAEARRQQRAVLATPLPTGGTAYIGPTGRHIPAATASVVAASGGLPGGPLPWYGAQGGHAVAAPTFQPPAAGTGPAQALETGAGASGSASGAQPGAAEAVAQVGFCCAELGDGGCGGGGERGGARSVQFPSQACTANRRTRTELQILCTGLQAGQHPAAPKRSIVIQDFTFGHLAPQPRGAIDLVTVASPTATPPNEDPGQIILAKLRRAVRRMANPATQQRMRNRRWGR